MPLTDPDFSANVRIALQIIKMLTVHFTGDRPWYGIIPGNTIQPEILAYLEDRDTGVLIHRGWLPASKLETRDGKKLIEFYHQQGGPELEPQMPIYEINFERADQTAVAAANCNISRAAAGRD